MSARVTRREFLRAGLGTGLSLGPLSGLTALVGCSGAEPRGARADPFAARYREALRRAQQAGPPVALTRVAAPGEVEVGPGKVYRTWLYEGAFPGPEIRVKEGQRLQVTLENRLPEATTVHWHGVPLPNAMDGVPDVTQAAVAPGRSFVYDFVAEPAGSYLYHSHVGLQLDRGLVGPLIVEERTPHVPYDQDHILVLDDWLPNEPTPASARGRGMMGGMRDMMGRMMAGGEMRPVDPARPQYAALLVNGRPPDDPPVFDVRRGARVRLRLLNLASARTFRVAIAGHRMTVTHTDGRPVANDAT